MLTNTARKSRRPITGVMLQCALAPLLIPNLPQALAIEIQIGRRQLQALTAATYAPPNELAKRTSPVASGGYDTMLRQALGRTAWRSSRQAAVASRCLSTTASRNAEVELTIGEHRVDMRLCWGLLTV